MREYDISGEESMYAANMTAPGTTGGTSAGAGGAGAGGPGSAAGRSSATLKKTTPPVYNRVGSYHAGRRIVIGANGAVLGDRGWAGLAGSARDLVPHNGTSEAYFTYK